MALQTRIYNGSALKKIFCVFLLVIVSFSVSACQVITKFKCNTKNWSEVGRKDGSVGYLAEAKFQKYYDECSASGSTIDKSIYMAGYQDGLATFCTMGSGAAQANGGYVNNKLCAANHGSAFDEGFSQGLVSLCSSSGGQRLGLTGNIYRGTCSSDTEQEFLTSYLNAIHTALPQAIANVTILEGKSNSLRSDIGSLEVDNSKYSNAIKSAKKSNNTIWRKQLESDQAVISSRLSTLRIEQRQTDRDLAKAQRTSNDMQKMLLEWKAQLDV